MKKKGFEALPESRVLVQVRGAQRQHGVVIDTRLLNVGKLGQKQTEVHDVSPG
ncbi:MAG: hypothetical protein CBARDMAM_3903 [uncultured Caballeronia sp.]|nr:MAG: hypothetical protein CBARDMAM_3903 [uncultured Caballeronia sp.]